MSTRGTRKIKPISEEDKIIAEIAAKLKALRIRAGMIPNDFAAAGIPRQTVHNLESGKYGVSIRTLLAYLHCIGCEYELIRIIKAPRGIMPLPYVGHKIKRKKAIIKECKRWETIDMLGPEPPKIIVKNTTVADEIPPSKYLHRPKPKPKNINDFF